MLKIAAKQNSIIIENEEIELRMIGGVAISLKEIKSEIVANFPLLSIIHARYTIRLYVRSIQFYTDNTNMVS